MSRVKGTTGTLELTAEDSNTQWIADPSTVEGNDSSGVPPQPVLSGAVLLEGLKWRPYDNTIQSSSSHIQVADLPKGPGGTNLNFATLLAKDSNAGNGRKRDWHRLIRARYPNGILIYRSLYFAWRL